MRYSIEEEILNRIELYYGSKKEALEWYDRKGMYFLDHFGHPNSPHEHVKQGDAREVLDWVIIALGEQ